MDEHHQRLERIAEENTGKTWTTTNVLTVLAMGIGSVGYGYSANVIAPILGISLHDLPPSCQ